LLAPGGDHVYYALDALKGDGSVESIGVSVYEPDELCTILSRYRIDLVQFPLNIFDQRFLRPDVTGACQKAGVSIHTRSSFLQGLLLMPPEAVPKRVVHARSRLAEFRDAARAIERTPLEICLGFLASISVVDAVVCGVAGLDELDEIAAAFGLPLHCKFDAARFATDDLDVIDPRRW
jgi:aryl-alcohol dehydrogenase-like predicted oxidoreductase